MYAYVSNNPLKYVDPLGLADIALNIVSINTLRNPDVAPYGSKMQIAYQLTIDGKPAVGYRFQEKGYGTVSYLDSGEWHDQILEFDKDSNGNKRDVSKPWDIGPTPENGYQIVTDCKGHFVDAPYGIYGKTPFSASWQQEIRAIGPSGDIINLGTNDFNMSSYSAGDVRWRLTNSLFGTFGAGR